MARRSRTLSRRRGSNTNRNAFFTKGSLVHVDQTTQTVPNRCNPNAIGGQLKISRNFFSTPQGSLSCLDSRHWQQTETRRGVTHWPDLAKKSAGFDIRIDRREARADVETGDLA